jgi:hypothetical protein
MPKHVYNVIPDKEDNRDFLVSAAPPSKHIRKLLPMKVDMRSKIPPVFNQGQEGSCTANAGCTSKSLAMKRPDLVFSRQYLYRKEREMEGTVNQDKGVQMRTICKAMTTYGICLEEFMPYIPANLYGPPTKEAEENAAKYKGGVYRKALTLQEIK